MKSETVIPLNDIALDTGMFTALSISTGRLIGTKQKFEHICVQCNVVYNAALCYERTKKHAWHCRSCAIKLEWSTASYRCAHENALRAAHDSVETREKHSRASRANWARADVREPMLEAIRAAHRTPQYRDAAKQRGREAFLRDPTRFLRSYASRQRGHYTKLDGTSVYLRSSYERRFAELLDARQIEWLYEPRMFALTELDCSYVPDFYIVHLDRFIEVKGHFYADALEKWHAFLTEHRGVKISLVKHDVLTKLESGESLESCLEA